MNFKQDIEGLSGDDITFLFEIIMKFKQWQDMSGSKNLIFCPYTDANRLSGETDD